MDKDEPDMDSMTRTKARRLLTMAKRGTSLLSSLILAGCTLPIPVFTTQSAAIQVIEHDESEPVSSGFRFTVQSRGRAAGTVVRLPGSMVYGDITVA